MAPTAALLQKISKTARSGCRQPGNVFVNKLPQLNHLSSPHVKRPPHARNTGEGGASVSPQIYCGKISERMRVRGTDDIAASYTAKFILDISMVQQ
jgi:hypothetical protein